jgi:hypothetical protein
MWILEQSEKAWSNYFTSRSFSSDVNCVPGVSITDKEGATLISNATGAEEVELGSGVYAVSMVLSLRIPYENRSDFLTYRNGLIEEFAEAVTGNVSIKEDLIRNGTNIHVFEFVLQGHTNDFEDTAIHSNIALTMYVSNTG